MKYESKTEDVERTYWYGPCEQFVSVNEHGEKTVFSNQKQCESFTCFMNCLGMIVNNIPNFQDSRELRDELEFKAQQFILNLPGS